MSGIRILVARSRKKWARRTASLIALTMLFGVAHEHSAFAGRFARGETGAAPTLEHPRPDGPPPVPPIDKLVVHSDGSLVGACEICVYIVQNKANHQPYLCRGLKNPDYQKNCVQVVESLTWLLTNSVYWLNYCDRLSNDGVERESPCPAHAVCSWIEQAYGGQSYCPADPLYSKPEVAPAN